MLKTIHEKLVNAIGSNNVRRPCPCHCPCHCPFPLRCSRIHTPPPPPPLQVPRVLVGSKSDLTTERQVRRRRLWVQSARPRCGVGFVVLV